MMKYRSVRQTRFQIRLAQPAPIVTLANSDPMVVMDAGVTRILTDIERGQRKTQATTFLDRHPVRRASR